MRASAGPLCGSTEAAVSVTHELNWLVRREFTLRNLAMMHATREVMGIPSSLLGNEAGDLVSRRLDKATTTMDGCEFLGRCYESHTLRRAVRLQIGIEQGNLLIPNRHPRIMRELGLYYSEPTWRKNGHRWALLGLLAEHIVRTNSNQTTK